MNRLINWLNQFLSSCLGRRCRGHAPLRENIDRDSNLGAKQMISLETIVIRKTKLPQTAPILNLNDDCLLEIFSHLSLFDLASVSSTCQRLQQLANYQFLSTNQPLAFSDAIVFGYDEIRDEERLTRALDILKAFGSLIDTFVVHDLIYFRMLPLLQAQMLST